MEKTKRVIDLSKKSNAAAKRIMKRILMRKDKETNKLVRRQHARPIQFILPKSNKPKKRNQDRINEHLKCPYCSSRLISTEIGTICSSENLRYIAMNIESTIRKHGKAKAEMFMSNKSLRFLDYYNLEGSNMRCEYILGNEERRWRINNRILSPGIDRKKIFGSK